MKTMTSTKICPHYVTISFIFLYTFKSNEMGADYNIIIVAPANILM